MAGSQQFLSNLIEELIAASNDQVLKLNDVASNAGTQVTELQTMVTKLNETVTTLGEVKAATESNTDFILEVGTEEQFLIDNQSRLVAGYGEVTVKSITMNADGKFNLNLLLYGYDTSNDFTFSLKRNGTQIYTKNTDINNPETINTTVEFAKGDVLDFILKNSSSIDRTISIKDININYNLAVKSPINQNYLFY
jgi:hypothetical protein